MPEFTKVWSVANIALIKLTAKLASSVHFVQSSHLFEKICLCRLVGKGKIAVPYPSAFSAKSIILS